MAVNAFFSQATLFINCWAPGEVDFGDKRGQSTYRAELEAPFAQEDYFDYENRREYEHSPTRLVELKEIP